MGVGSMRAVALCSKFIRHAFESDCGDNNNHAVSVQSSENGILERVCLTSKEQNTTRNRVFSNNKQQNESDRQDRPDFFQVLRPGTANGVHKFAHVQRDRSMRKIVDALKTRSRIFIHRFYRVCKPREESGKKSIFEPLLLFQPGDRRKLQKQQQKKLPKILMLTSLVILLAHAVRTVIFTKTNKCFDICDPNSTGTRIFHGYSNICYLI